MNRWEAYVRQVLIGSIVNRVPLLLYGCAWLWRRMLFRTTFIAVSGSLGKTTTKELLAAILATKAPTFRTWRNQNSRSSVALNVLRVRPWHRFAVLEVEAGAPGAMDWPAWCVAPDVTVMICIAPTHTNTYEDLDAHAREKLKIIRSTRSSGCVILNGDDPRVAGMAAEFPGRVLFFRVTDSGVADAVSPESAGAVPGPPPAAVSGTVMQHAWPARLSLHVTIHPPFAQAEIPVETQLIGRHWAYAVLGAFTAARALGVAPGAIARSLSKTPPFPGRLFPVRSPNGAIFLRDDYNASVWVLDASLHVLRNAQAARRILVLTDFSDFGANRRQRLKFLATQVAKSANALVIVGAEAQYGARRAIEAGLPEHLAHAFPALEEAAEFLRGWTEEGDLILVKGRTTDHAARLVLAQFSPIACWKPYCAKRMLCDICWELKPAHPTLLQLQPLPPGE